VAILDSFNTIQPSQENHADLLKAVDIVQDMLQLGDNDAATQRATRAKETLPCVDCGPFSDVGARLALESEIFAVDSYERCRECNDECVPQISPLIPVASAMIGRRIAYLEMSKNSLTYYEVRTLHFVFFLIVHRALTTTSTVLIWTSNLYSATCLTVENRPRRTLVVIPATTSVKRED
jgi:hypothetical protein